MPSAILKRPAAAAPAAKQPAAKQPRQEKKVAQASGKPPAKEVSAKPAKQAKQPAQPKRDPLLTKVAAGLELAKDLPQAAQEMLNSMLVHALAACKEERHEFQAVVVSLADQALTAVEQGLQTSLDKAQQEAEGIEADKETREAAVQAGENRLEQQKAEVSKAKHTLADAARAFRAAKEAVAEAKLAQEEAERDISKAAADKEQLQGAVADFLRPLLSEGCAAEGAEGKADSLMQILAKCSMDQSMMSALPTALLKEPSARGSFDTMVLSQLEAEVGKRVAELAARLKEAEPAKIERASRLEKAEASLQESKERQLDGAGVLQEATAEEGSRQAALQDAKRSVAEAVKEAKRLGREAERSQRALSLFRDGPLAAFCHLRDLSAAPPPAVAEAEGEGEEQPEGEKAADAASGRGLPEVGAAAVEDAVPVEG